MAANKVTHVINCAGLQIPNHWEPIGVQYLTFGWLDTDHQIILDAKEQVTTACYAFIEDALAKTESTLVHSVKGQSRAATVLAAYMMRKYRWSLLKTFQFLSYRRPDLEVRSAFIQQLAAYEARLHKTAVGPRTTTWAGTSLSSTAEISDPTFELENEELILRNTYVNAMLLSSAAAAAELQAPKERKKPVQVQWADSKPECKETIATVIVEKDFVPDPSGRPAEKTGEPKDLKPIIKHGLAGRSEREDAPASDTGRAETAEKPQIVLASKPKDSKESKDPKSQAKERAKRNAATPDETPPHRNITELFREIKDIGKGPNKRNMPLAKKPALGFDRDNAAALHVLPGYSNPNPNANIDLNPASNPNPRLHARDSVTDPEAQGRNEPDEVATIIQRGKDLPTRYPGIIANIINNNNINNIIIQNAQKVELTAYNPRIVTEARRVENKAKRVAPHVPSS